jgi:hypothetical protein
LDFRRKSLIEITYVVTAFSVFPLSRKIAWKHLLNVYPAGMTGGERIRYLRQLSQTYAQLKADWMDLVLQVS